MTKITHIVVHYTATYEDQLLTAADIDKMHRQRGWKMIGYHWIIRRDGTVEQGRPENMTGAHVGGQNTGKIGISWIGGLNRATGPDKGVDNRTDAQKASLIKLIKECLVRYPGAKVVGHRDLAPTQCPGFDVEAWWAKVQGGSKTPIDTDEDTPTHTPGVGEDSRHVVEKGDTFWSVSRQYGLTLEQLRAWNPRVNENKLTINDILYVSPPPAPYRTKADILSDMQMLVDELKQLP